MSLSIALPRTMFGGNTVDFGWARQSHSWLLLVQQRLGGLHAQEIELSPTSRGKLTLRVVRSSGRMVADGTASGTGDTCSFRLKIRCPPGTATIEGSLSFSAGSVIDGRHQRAQQFTDGVRRFGHRVQSRIVPRHDQIELDAMRERLAPLLDAAQRARLAAAAKTADGAADRRTPDSKAGATPQ